MKGRVLNLLFVGAASCRLHMLGRLKAAPTMRKAIFLGHNRNEMRETYACS